MLTDFRVIKNFFNDPDKIRQVALQQTYHTYEQESSFVKNNSRFPGRRTGNLFNSLDKLLYKELMDEFFNKLFKETVRPDCNINYNATGYPVFHSLFENDSDMGVGGLHRDSTILAAVVYLNHPQKEHCGTLINNGIDFEVPYEYNTCVMYRGDFLHGAAGGFGNTIETSRLSMNFFISDIELSLHSFSL